MKTLQQLIDELCPNGVEFRKLGDICEIKTGKGVTKKDAHPSGNFPIISGGKTPMEFLNYFNREANTVTISRVGANAGYVSYQTTKFYLNDKCFSSIPRDKTELDSKFLYYVLKNKEPHIINLQSEGGVPTINTQKVGNIEIPLPPLAVQERIVEILDKFTALTAELQAELQARQQQYEYYRDRLLSFGGPNNIHLNDTDVVDRAAYGSADVGINGGGY